MFFFAKGSVIELEWCNAYFTYVFLCPSTINFNTAWKRIYRTQSIKYQLFTLQFPLHQMHPPLPSHVQQRRVGEAVVRTNPRLRQV